jgi:pimeloyl-ACP methyl ester carboxylesterase
VKTGSAGRFSGHDGRELSYRELGSGRPLVLLHGFAGSASQWLDHGPASELAERGHRVILPDLRGHGDSARPHGAASYPADVLVDDGLALIDRLGLDDFDLGGYSLGARVVLRMLVAGARPSRAIVAGQGLTAVTSPVRDGRYRRVLTALANQEPIRPGSSEAEVAHWISHLGGDPKALLRVLDSLVATQEEELAEIVTPTLVAVGDQDFDQASGGSLAAILPNARFARVGGDHWTALGGPGLTEEILAFLATRPDDAIQR